MLDRTFTVRLSGQRAEYFNQLLREMNDICERTVSAQEVFGMMVDIMMENSSFYIPPENNAKIDADVA